MSKANFITITAANCPASSRSAAESDMAHFAGECKENGALRITYGSVISGRYPGALVFIQFFDSLAGLESVMEMMPVSSSYKRLIEEHAVVPFGRNVFRGKSIDFDPVLEPQPNYLMLTRARRHALEENEMLDLLNMTTPVFKSAGAQTMRMGQTLTGSDLGTYMLGVTYPDMSSIERAYDGLGTNPAFVQLMNGLDVDMRSITKIAGIL